MKVVLPALLLVGGMLGLVILVTFECTSTSIQDVETRVGRDLPKGSTTEEINRYLDEEKIYHEAPVAAGLHIRLTDLGVPSDAMVIRAYIPKTGYADLVTTKNIGIYFVLDDYGRLKETIVLEELTGF